MEQDKKTVAKKSVKKWTEEEKQSYCKAWQKSGLSRSGFCRREGLSFPTFCNWLKRQNTASHLAVPRMEFMVAPILKESSAKEEQILEVRLPNGLHCRFSRVVNINQICKIIEGLQHVPAH